MLAFRRVPHYVLIGGIVGATTAAVGLRVIWSGVVSKVIVPAVVMRCRGHVLVGAVGTWLVWGRRRRGY
ncbi:hypothetical protein ABLN97_03930 [Mycobacterium tuberculosis]